MQETRRRQEWQIREDSFQLKAVRLRRRDGLHFDIHRILSKPFGREVIFFKLFSLKTAGRGVGGGGG